MTNVLNMPVPQQYLDDNGDPLSNGKVYTYVAGSTTKVVTYGNQEITVQNTNPIILDSAGRCSLWVAGNTDIVVTDSEDNFVSSTSQHFDVVNWSSVIGKPTTMTGLGVSSVDWSLLVNKPNTTAGYGITEIDWNLLSGTPTTIDGYGIVIPPTQVGRSVIMESSVVYNQNASPDTWDTRRLTTLDNPLNASFIYSFANNTFMLEPGYYKFELLGQHRGYGDASSSYGDDAYTATNRIFDTNSFIDYESTGYRGFAGFEDEVITIQTYQVELIGIVSYTTFRVDQKWVSGQSNPGEILFTKLIVTRTGDL